MEYIDSMQRYFYKSAEPEYPNENVEDILNELDDLKKEAARFFKDAKKQIAENYKGPFYEADDIIKLVDYKKELLDDHIRKIRKDIKR